MKERWVEGLWCHTVITKSPFMQGQPGLSPGATEASTVPLLPCCRTDFRVVGLTWFGVLLHCFVFG